MKGTGKVGTIRGEEAGKGKGAKNRVGSRDKVTKKWGGSSEKETKNSGSGIR